MIGPNTLNKAFKRIALTLVMLLLVAAGVWQYKLPILLAIAPKLMDWRQPIAVNREVPWRKGPDTASDAPARRPPNIILVLVDDMGFNDISLYNGGAADGTLQTPAIDALAAQGVRFNQGYAANAVCAPSRASILTGRYATRFGFEFTPVPAMGPLILRWSNDQNPSPLPTYFPAASRPGLDMALQGMPLSEVTIAELLKQRGYYTAHIGKWHLGGSPEHPDFLPVHQGFDDSLTMSGMLYLPEDSPDVVNAKRSTQAVERMVWATARYAVMFNEGERFAPEGYLTDYFTDQALQVIEHHQHDPFFLYLAHWGIHNPLQATRADYEALAHIADPTLRVYAAMIRAVDRSVARISAKLDELGLAENTLIVFTSDNGGAGYIGLPDINAPFRGWKLTHFEGGVHVPFMARWPARIAAGSVMQSAVHHTDIFATLAAAAGVDPPDDRPVDGVNLLPFIAGEAAGEPHKRLFWKQGHLHTVLQPPWKLIRDGRQQRIWLFDIEADPTEQHDLSDRHPAVAAELEATLDRHIAEQAEPLWPTFVDSPVLIDRHGEEPYQPGDEFSYWPN